MEAPAYTGIDTQGGEHRENFLVVTDNPHLLDRIREAGRQLMIGVTPAAHVRQAIIELGKHAFDGILIDEEVEGGGALAFARRLLDPGQWTDGEFDGVLDLVETDLDPDVPVALLASDDSLEHRQEAMAIGAAVFVEKSSVEGQLAELLLQLTTRRRARACPIPNGFSRFGTVSGQGSATPTRTIESVRAGVNPAPTSRLVPSACRGGVYPLPKFTVEVGPFRIGAPFGGRRRAGDPVRDRGRHDGAAPVLLRVRGR